MGKIYEAIKKADKDFEKNLLAPVIKKDQNVLPAIIDKDRLIPGIEWCRELKSKITTLYPEDKIKSIMFTGISDRVGCTNLLSTYAIDLFKSYSLNILAVDANIRKSDLGNTLDIYNETTIAEFYESMSNKKKSRGNGSGKLNFVKCNNAKNIRDLNIFESSQFNDFLIFAKQHYHYILLDSSSILKHPETRSLARVVDGVVLIAQSEKSRLPVLERAKKEIELSGGNLLGVLLNKKIYHIPNILYRWLF